MKVDQSIVALLQPELSYVYDPSGVPSLTGNFVVLTRSGIPERIATTITFPLDYPRREPRAKEVGGRFPHEVDRHFYEDGTACLWLDVESKWMPRDPEALRDFLDEVATFYLRQLMMESDPSLPYPGPARAHGYTPAYVEYLAEKLRMPAYEVPFMRKALARGLSRNAPCPCGSGIRFRHCHQVLVEDFRARMQPDRLVQLAADLDRAVRRANRGN